MNTGVFVPDPTIKKLKPDINICYRWDRISGRSVFATPTGSLPPAVTGGMPGAGGSSRGFTVRFNIGNGDDVPEYAQGQMVYNDVGDIDLDPSGSPTGTRVQYKYHINMNNFEFGYVTQNDNWDNYWRAGPNSVMGWGWATGSTTTGSGTGAASMGRELADSYAFAQCQVKKVFKNVCLRDPVDAADRTQIDNMITSFSTGYNLKNVFAESAVYCRGS